MPKMKTKKTFAKRVKVTANRGSATRPRKLQPPHNFTSHFAANKTHKQKVNLRKSAIVSASDTKRDRALLQG